MGNLERSLAFAGLAMAAGACDDTAAGSKSFDGGDISIRDFGAADMGDSGMTPIDGDVKFDGGSRDATLTDAALNAEFLCESNADCLPLQYCRELGEDVGSVCRDNPTGPNEEVQPGVDLCGTNADCPEGEYCHIDGTVNGSACVENPTGPIERPDAGTTSPRLDGGVNPPTPDAAGSQPPRPDAAVNDLDGAVVAADGAVVIIPVDASVAHPDGAIDLDAGVPTDGAVNGDGGTADGSGDAASDASDAYSDAGDAGDAGDAEIDAFAGPFPPFADAAATDAVRADARVVDAVVVGSDAVAADGTVSDASTTDGGDVANFTDAAMGADGLVSDAVAADGALSDASTDDASDIQADGTTDGATDAVQDSTAGDQGVDAGDVGASDATADAAEIPEEPCGGECPAGELCNPVENLCEEPSCTVNEDCADSDDRCFVIEEQGPGEGVCVSPDIELALEVGHADGTIHGLSTTNVDRQHWNVPPEITHWSGNLDTRDQGVALLVPATLEALTAHCGDMARCVLREADNGLFSRVSREGVTFGPNETIALPGGANIMTVEDVRSAAAEDLVGACFFADRLCQ